MPVDNYGVWKGHPVDYILTDRQNCLNSPQFSLFFHDRGLKGTERNGISINGRNGTAGLCRAAINITSGDLHDSRLVYWVNHQLDQNPMVDKLSHLKFGFTAQDSSGSQGLGLDYIRHSLFNSTNGRLLPHDIPGQFGDIIDVMVPTIKQAVEEDAEIYIFGSRSQTGNEIHNIHMNQGNACKFRDDDGVFKDGGLIFHFQSSGEWLGIFLAFASQAVHTNDKSGHAISGVGWSDILRPDIIEDAVVIQEAYVNPAGPCGRRKSVTLSNRTNRAVRLESWAIRNAAGDIQKLPKGAALRPRIDRPFELEDWALSDRGDTILLLNEQGLRVDGVSYNLRHGTMKGGSIAFKR